MNTLSILAASVLVLVPPHARHRRRRAGPTRYGSGWRSTGVRCQPDETSCRARRHADGRHGPRRYEHARRLSAGRCARPHAYSGGYTLDSGKYALAGPRQLRLADEHSFGTLLVDRLERVDTRDATSTAFDAQAWFGRDYDRLVVKAEGDYANGRLEEARTELLWGTPSRAIGTHSSGCATTPERAGPPWLAFGIQGLAPYWFELDATAYVGNEGRSAFVLRRSTNSPSLNASCCSRVAKSIYTAKG